MFGFGEKGKIELSKKIIELSSDASEQFFNYIKEDEIIYSKCINDNPIKNTSTIFMINIYRDMLNLKYDEEDVFKVVYTAVASLSTDSQLSKLCLNSFMEYMNSCNQSIEYYKNLPNFDVADVLTKVFFALVIDDSDYLQMNLEDEISESVSYKKIYNYIKGILKYSTLLNKEYKLKLK